MIVFRLSKLKYARDLSGRGAEQSGGRWNSKGVAVVYTSDSRALCTTEIAVHTSLGNVPLDYCIISIEIPDTAKIAVRPVSKLPLGWNVSPHSSTTQAIGDKFIFDSNDLVLKVPSAVVPGDFNYLLNPNHKDFSKIKIVKVEAFTFDDRLFVK